MKAILYRWIRCYARYFDFRNRAARPEFWSFMFCTIAMSFLLWSLVALTATTGHVPVAGILFPVTCCYWGLTVIPFLAVTARRLHDRGLSARWVAAMVGSGLLMALFSGTGSLGMVFSCIYLPLQALVLLFCLMPGQGRPNRYGDVPSD